jgi:hypothetical protein
MPCRDYWVNDYEQFGRASSSALRVVTELKDRNDTLARVACKAMYALENGTDYQTLMKDPEVKRWWVKHKAEDIKQQAADEKQRIKDEKQRIKDAELAKVKANIMAKLTPEEIAAFGLDKKGKTR